MQPRNIPLHITVAFKLPGNIHFVIFDITRQFQLRHINLPTAAIQTAAGFHQAVEFGRPVRELLRRVDVFEFQLAAPADGFAPVEHRFQVGVALQCGDTQLIEVKLLLVACRVQSDSRRRDLIAFNRAAE